MAIPQAIQTDIAFLQNQVAANQPLAEAPHPNIVAMQLNATALVNEVEMAQYSLAGALDTYTWTPGDDPAVITAAVMGLRQSGIDEANIALIRAVVGRVKSNLDQLT